MKRNIFSIAIMAIAMVLFSTNEAKAQLPEGNIGLGATVGFSSNELVGVANAAQIYFAPSEMFDLALSLGFTNMAPDDGDASMTMIMAGLQGRIFMTEKSNTIDPYVAVAANYYMNTDTEDSDNESVDSGIGIGLAWGLQAELVKNVFLTAQVGFEYMMMTDNEATVNGQDVEGVGSTALTLGGSRLGFIIYMQD